MNRIKMAAVAAAVFLPSAAQALPKVGTSAPAIVLPDIHGRNFRLAALAGKEPVLVNFFQST